jgi:hypothetical protein
MEKEKPCYKSQDSGYPRHKNYKYGTAIVSAVLYGCESWSVTLKEEHRLRVMRTEC